MEVLALVSVKGPIAYIVNSKFLLFDMACSISISSCLCFLAESQELALSYVIGGLPVGFVSWLGPIVHVSGPAALTYSNPKKE